MGALISKRLEIFFIENNHENIIPKGEHDNGIDW